MKLEFCHGGTRLVTMPGGRKRPWESQRGMGVQGHQDAGATVFENLGAGVSIEEVMEEFDVTREQIEAVLKFAARSLSAPPQVPPFTPADVHTV
jgi:hypothetical protein